MSKGATGYVGMVTEKLLICPGSKFSYFAMEIFGGTWENFSSGGT